MCAKAHACAASCVMFFTRSWLHVLFAEVSLPVCRMNMPPVWRAEPCVSVSGQLVLCDDRGTLVRRRTGEVLAIVTELSCMIILSCNSLKKTCLWYNPPVKIITAAPRHLLTLIRIQYNHCVPPETKSVSGCCTFLPALIMQS